VYLCRMDNLDYFEVHSTRSTLKYKPILGAVYGKWTVISDKRYRGKSNRFTYWKVKCECGREAFRTAHHLANLKHTQCKSCAKTRNGIDTYILSYYNKTVRRAETINKPCTVTAKELEQLYFLQQKCCALSGVPIEFRPNFQKNEQTASLDRIDSTKGYTEDNVQWVHKDVNFMKNKLTETRFVELCKLISSKCG